jgi:hypothetical protein
LNKTVGINYDTSQMYTNSTTGQLGLTDNFIASQYGRLPVCTTAQRTALTAVIGQLVYDTDLSGVYIYTGTAWKKVGSSMIQAAVYFNEIPNDGLVPAQVLPTPSVSVGTSVAPRNQ